MMNWKVIEAKNGEPTLLLNDITIYSKYRPSDDAARWMHVEFDENATHYLLIGLGLGYHLRALAERVGTKPITVYYFDQAEYELFLQHNMEWWKQNNINIVSTLSNKINNNSLQILVPNVWSKAIGKNHPLYDILEIIRLKQVSYKEQKHDMESNILDNLLLNDPSIRMQEQTKFACIVSAGPSLNTTVKWLKEIQHKVDIYVVGSALKVLEAHDIIPKGVVHADPSDKTIIQFDNTNFNGELYYLSTANKHVIASHKGPRYILMQQGFSLAEKYAAEKGMPILDTGGSVGTVAFSLIEQLGYSKVVLFGQDLNLHAKTSHASHSPANRNISENVFTRQVVSNDGSVNATNTTLYAFWYWYNEKCQCTSMQVFNTAEKGAKINNVPLINEQQLYDLINQS